MVDSVIEHENVAMDCLFRVQFCNLRYDGAL